MKTIKVNKPKNNSLIQQLVAFYLTFRNISPKERVNFDLSQLNWLSPFLILPISTHIQETKSKFITPQNPNVISYLKKINFPDGVISVSEFQKFLTYIPISILKRGDDLQEKEKLVSCFAETIYKVLKPATIVYNAIYYPITELVTNIFEHSKKDIGYIFAQYYPQKEFLDLCIVDRGRGLVRAYKEEKNLNFTDKEAIIRVLKGYSTKKPDLERGYGVRTSKRVVCEGLGGDLILLSGNSAFYASKNKEEIIFLPNFYWQGVIIVYRIPQPKTSINITPYIEG